MQTVTATIEGDQWSTLSSGIRFKRSSPTAVVIPESVDMPALPWRVLIGCIPMDWHHVKLAAKPYLVAMNDMGSAADNFGHDSGNSVMLRFLVNAQAWHGPTARKVKAELLRRVDANTPNNHNPKRG
jgi:hypothetical protein